MDETKNVDYVNAETIEVDGENNGEAKKSKRDYYIELALFLILGILLGIAIKTEAVKRVTMGYNDYKMKIMSQDIDIDKLQKDLLAKEIEAAEEGQEEGQTQNPGENAEGSGVPQAGENNGEGQENNNQ